ncbi:hypothetical protein GCM10010270_53280 [Streptomyces violaceus]|nr:hypothetical protein GCM10010270_53280 [Streptomyces janthinus]
MTYASPIPVMRSITAAMSTIKALFGAWGPVGMKGFLWLGGKFHVTALPGAPPGSTATTDEIASKQPRFDAYRPAGFRIAVNRR